MNIVGAGLSGLIAAHVWPNATVYEIAPEPTEQHKALLRFRSDAVAQVTGIEFKKVLVRKGIWHEGCFTEPNIGVANLYTTKCLGLILGDRSIWNIAPAERYIAPQDFYSMLVDNCGRRIEWGYDYPFNHKDGPHISTIPLPIVLIKTGTAAMPEEFKRQPITVQRFRIKGCDAYQTIYFPTPDHSVYRASITGDLLIVEHTCMPNGNWEREVFTAFAIKYSSVEPLESIEQKYGKIAPINDDAARKRLLFELTHKHNVYSLGRFAIWKNILLDDVVTDAAVIKRLMRGNIYDTHKAMHTD